jgi:hypothetical protein
MFGTALLIVTLRVLSARERAVDVHALAQLRELVGLDAGVEAANAHVAFLSKSKTPSRAAPRQERQRLRRRAPPVTREPSRGS